MKTSSRKQEPSAFGISTKMARTLADTWRFRILVEVTVRPLSPSQFVEEFGGELPQVSRCFRQLATWGYIRVAEERLGRRGGASIEHVYEAVRRAHFDLASWEEISTSDRQAVSYSILSSYFRRIQEALESGTFDQDVDRHLSWDAVALDRPAWKEINDRLDEVLESLTEIELDASDRLSGSETEAISTIVGLTSFRSSQAPSRMLEAPRRRTGPAAPNDAGSDFGIGTKLAKALSSRWRCLILMETSIRPLSPSQFLEEVGGSMSNISRCFRELEDWGYLELVEKRKGGRKGGGVEKVYRSTCRAYFDASSWKALPKPLREEISQFFLDSFLAQVGDAVHAETFDAELDRHLSWKPLVLDRIAWTEIGATLDGILEWLPDLEATSLKRTRGDTDLLIPAFVCLTCFRSPQPEPPAADS